MTRTVILINGSFGVGKTTVAGLLRRRLPGSVIVDPELLGIAMLMLSKAWPFGQRVADFQDLRAWRHASACAIRIMERLRSTIIVPMAFSNRVHLGELQRSIGGGGVEIFHFCLVAPHEVVLERLRQREGRRGPSPWQLRRSAECCAAHLSPDFAVQIPTAARTPEEIADDIVRRVRA
jgi:chloramphenicol 3-O-phosphotransferase